MGAKTKAKDMIRLPDGRTMTLGDALDSGIAYVTESTYYDPPRYFARVGTDVSWEINKTLFHSRSGHGVTIGKNMSGGNTGQQSTGVLATFHTRTGKIAIEVKQYGPRTFGYSGAYGAGSGGDLSEVKKRVLSTLSQRRGIKTIFISEEFARA